MRGLSAIAGVALEQLVGFVAAVTAEVAVQQVHHRPEVTSFFDVHLEQVAHVVEARRGVAEVALLLDRRRLGVALHDEQAAQLGAMLAGHVVPHRLALAVAERDAPIGLGVGEEDAPPVVGHPHVVEVRPALLADRDRGAQEHVVALGARRGRATRHQSTYFGSHPSSARCSRRSSARPTLFGILVSRSTVVIRHAPCRSRPSAGAVALAGRRRRRPRSAVGRSSSARR